ncbi:ECF transporter S component [uncultured Bifidobacterium sp.]|uniref:ECF transporter S component n=1 Tax=uncultured Bifidobacterium sp. TaxID=165187 RepID=UPI0026394543|nr:ECF transporter S component [uncultured Bifidobacterium sp.]
MSDSATMSVRALRRADLPKLSLSIKAAATVLAIVAAVALPQLFHVIGAVSGQGTMLGVAFLPMHLPIIFVGLIAGPAAGAIAGAAAPLASFLLSGMPMLAMLPLMIVELFAYGLVAGLLREVKLPSLVKVVIVQLAGRVVLTAATAIAVFAFGSSKTVAATWTSDLAAGLPGLALQWALIPLAAYWTESLIAKRNH